MRTAEDIINAKKKAIISVPPDTTLQHALTVMLENRIGAMLVQNEDQIIGIWTERDLMSNTLVQGFDPRTALIKTYMTTQLVTAPHTDTIYLLLDKFLGRRLRHLLIEKNGKIIGLLSTGDVVRANLNEKTRELEELNAMVSWEYYENWGWSGSQPQ